MGNVFVPGNCLFSTAYLTSRDMRSLLTCAVRKWKKKAVTKISLLHTRYAHMHIAYTIHKHNGKKILGSKHNNFTSEDSRIAHIQIHTYGLLYLACRKIYATVCLKIKTHEIWTNDDNISNKQHPHQ